MKIKFLLGALLITLSYQVFSFDAGSYIGNLKFSPTPTQGDAQVLGVLDYCSNANNMKPDCVLPQLTALQDNPVAKNILSEYARAQSEGKFNQLPECQTQKHQDTNYVLAHCMLVMNLFALKNLNRDAAINKYQTCLQGGLIGLAYDGNMSAQYLLSQIFKGRGIQQSAEVWQNSLEYKKGTEEDLLMRKCYF